MKDLKAYKIIVSIVLAMFLLISVLMYFFFDKIKKMYQEISSKPPVDTTMLANRSEVFDKIKQDIKASDLAQQPKNISPCNLPFLNKIHLEIPVSIHGKNSILHVQTYNSVGVQIFPPTKIIDLTTIIIDFSIEESGTVKIF